MRSNDPSVRNPILKLKSAQKIASLPPESQAVLREILVELSTECRALADKSWRSHKAPMAAYWKAMAVYTRHFARLLLPRSVAVALKVAA